MYLSKLEIFGFKSFAEKTTIGFDSGIAAIVGPNGSGKSNIVDAIRWVLGEQGDKALRSEKREDIVFSGTSRRKPLGLAEVAITIINNKGVLPTEYSEVQIARRFYRSGETEYYLNGTKVRLKDIKNLFIDTGIGPDAYSVIELKMVETILSHVKNERRKLFEEAAGIVSYKKNRDLTINKLESVHESLLRVNDIIREKQRNVNALERQVKRNEEARQVATELEALEIKVGNVDYSNKIIEIENIKNNEEEGISLKERLSVEIKEYDEKLDALRVEVSSFETGINSLAIELNSKKEEINKIERENLVTDQKLNSISENVRRLSDENESFKRSIENNKEKEEELNRGIAVLKNSVEASERSLAEKKYNVDETIKLISEKKNELKDLGAKLKEVIKSLNEKKSGYERNKAKLEHNLIQLEKLSTNNSESLTNVNKLEEEKNKLENTLTELLEKYRAAENTLNINTKEKNELSADIETLEKEINSYKLELHKKTSKIEYLKNLLENFEDYAEGIKFLVKERNEPDIQTVIDSIQVEDKYKFAVETALGEVSNYLILENSKDISRLTDLLAENDKGKVTFILNDKLNFKNLYFEDVFERPDFLDDKGVYGFADTFVKSKSDKYLLLLRYLLDEYVIVEDRETAIRHSKDNYYKFITLKGDIITESFVRAGSDMKEENVKLGRESQIKRVSEEATILERKTESKEDDLKIIRDKYETINIEKYKEITDGLRKEVHQFENDIAKIDFKIQETNRNIAKNDESYKNIENENTELNTQINNLIEEVNTAESEQSNLDKELAFLTDEFNEIEQRYSEYNKDYYDFNIEFTKLKNELKNEEQSYQRIVNSIEFQQRRTRENNESIEREKSLSIELKNKVEGNNNNLTSLREEESEISERYNAKKSLFDEKKANQNRIDLEQRERRMQFDKVSQSLIDSQVRIKECEIKSEQIKDYILKKYEIEIPLPEQNISGEQQAEEDSFDIFQAKKEVEQLSDRLKRLGGGYQQVLFEDFEQEKEDLEKMVEQKNDLTESEKDIRKTIERINKEARERFLETFEQIRENFIMIFKELFSEGDEANLRLVYDVDEEGKINEDPLEAKIEITAKPRGKRPTSIELLSGGEKTLTAIALLFAIYLVKPSPFCVLDEVDAPLDVANLARFNKLIRKFSNNTQFILITHNERTMESVDRLYGVTMQEQGVTTIVETSFKEKAQAN